MNWFGNSADDNLLEEMIEYLQDHRISDLLRVVQAAVECEEET